MPRVVVNGISMAFDDLGASEDVVVLIHGHPFNRSMWRPQMDALSRAGWRVIAPDLRGYGETTVVPGKTTLETLARDLAGLLDELDIERSVLVGLSMGGQIAMEFGRIMACRLRALVLVATFPRADTDEGRHTRLLTADRLEREGMTGYADELLVKMLAPGSIEALPDVVSDVLTMMRTTPPEGAAAALRGRAERQSYDATLERLAMPALVVVGDEDAFTTRTDAELMEALLSQSRLVWMAGVGHMPNLERTAEFNDELVRFLEEVRA